ncbi:hypothetical protein [Pseudomonas sp. LjRoot263]|uniref:hypothetical protein n=1 Tax=Pseudomonas sp. LjRoot263 TaxID=3342302 RepID=UPI003ECF6004
MPTENKPTEPLQVERSTVTKLVITGAPRLDPITVFLEDFGRRDCPAKSLCYVHDRYPCRRQPDADRNHLNPFPNLLPPRAA